MRNVVKMLFALVMASIAAMSRRRFFSAPGRRLRRPASRHMRPVHDHAPHAALFDGADGAERAVLHAKPALVLWEDASSAI